MEAPVAFEISNALLFEEPSMYSENNKSVAVELELVVTFNVLLASERLPAASFAFTEKE